MPELKDGGVQEESSTSTDGLEIEGSSSSEESVDSQGEENSDSQVGEAEKPEKTDPPKKEEAGKNAAARIKEVLAEKKALEKQIEELKAAKKEEPETKEKKGPLSPDGEKFAQQVTEKVLAELQRIASEGDEERSRREKEADKTINDLKERMGDDYESFREFAKTEVEMYPGATLESLEKAWEKRGDKKTGKVAEPSKGSSGVVAKIIKTNPNDDFVTTAHKANAMLGGK